jgi:hypothetical protein
LHLVACLFMFLLILNEQRVPKFTFVLNSNFLRKPLLIRSTAFICNIDRDMAVKTVESKKQRKHEKVISQLYKVNTTKYLQHFINKHDTIVSN